MIYPCEQLTNRAASTCRLTIIEQDASGELYPLFTGTEMLPPQAGEMLEVILLLDDHLHAIGPARILEGIKQLAHDHDIYITARWPETSRPSESFNPSATRGQIHIRLYTRDYFDARAYQGLLAWEHMLPGFRPKHGWKTELPKVFGNGVIAPRHILSVAYISRNRTVSVFRTYHE